MRSMPGLWEPCPSGGGPGRPHSARCEAATRRYPTEVVASFETAEFTVLDPVSAFVGPVAVPDEAAVSCQHTGAGHEPSR